MPIEALTKAIPTFVKSWTVPKSNRWSGERLSDSHSQNSKQAFHLMIKTSVWSKVVALRNSKTRSSFLWSGVRLKIGLSRVSLRLTSHCRRNKSLHASKASRTELLSQLKTSLTTWCKKVWLKDDMNCWENKVCKSSGKSSGVSYKTHHLSSN